MKYLFEQSILGYLVLLTLLGMSIWSWAVAFAKSRAFKNVLKENQSFHDEFWKGLSFEELLTRSSQFPNSTLASMYKEVSNELIKLRQTTSSTIKIDNIERVLTKVSNEQLEKLETHIGTLGSIGSVAPFIGLFGTVCGIMMSFSQIGEQKSASLAVVAPGISEALIATAVGLFAAIPSVLFFNRFQNKLRKIETSHHSFSNDLTNILNRKYT